MAEYTSSDKAVIHVLNRMLCDGRLAYILGPGSEAYDLIIAAYAKIAGVNVEEFRQWLSARLRYTEVPR